MCLIALAWELHPEYRLLAAANRDEFYARPAAPAHFWDGPAGILAGRDLLEGGTWMGVTKSGRFAAVTNYRQGRPADRFPRSRGSLVRRFLEEDVPAEAYLTEVSAQGSEYGGFSLLVCDGHALGYCSNRASGWRLLPPGLYSLSNGLLDEPWPKVLRAKAAIEHAAGRSSDPEWITDRLLEFLADRTPALDNDLPDTGLGIEHERLLAPVFVETPLYGTRSSSVLLIRRDGSEAFFCERSRGDDGRMGEPSRFTLALEAESR